MALTKEKKTTVVKKFQRSEKDTGSDDVQIALLTTRINELTKHFAVNKKDHHSRLGLIKMVERRKRLLNYMQTTYPERYQKIIKELELRK